MPQSIEREYYKQQNSLTIGWMLADRAFVHA